MEIRIELSSRINQLKPILIKDLIENCVHTGRILHGRVQGHVMLDNYGVIRLSIQDETKTTARVTISEYPDSGNGKLSKVFGDGEEIHILEPYYTIFQRVNTIHVGNPGEFHLRPINLSDCDAKSAADWNEDGNRAFKNKEFKKAIEFYNETINKIRNSAADSAEGNLFSTLHSSKAACFLLNDQFPQASESARESLKYDAENIKAHYQLVVALLHMRSVTEAKTEFENLKKKIRISNKTAQYSSDIIELEKKFKLFDENTRGQFEWAEFVKSYIASASDAMGLEPFDYINPKLEIKKSEQAGGLGVFSTEAIKSGELLMFCRAFEYLTGQEIKDAANKFDSAKPNMALIQMTRNLPSLIMKALFLKVLKLIRNDSHKLSELFQLGGGNDDCDMPITKR